MRRLGLRCEGTSVRTQPRANWMCRNPNFINLSCCVTPSDLQIFPFFCLRLLCPMCKSELVEVRGALVR